MGNANGIAKVSVSFSCVRNLNLIFIIDQQYPILVHTCETSIIIFSFDLKTTKDRTNSFS